MSRRTGTLSCSRRRRCRGTVHALLQLLRVKQPAGETGEGCCVSGAQRACNLRASAHRLTSANLRVFLALPMSSSALHAQLYGARRGERKPREVRTALLSVASVQASTPHLRHDTAGTAARSRVVIKFCERAMIKESAPGRPHTGRLRQLAGCRPASSWWGATSARYSRASRASSKASLRATTKPVGASMRRAACAAS